MQIERFEATLAGLVGQSVMIRVPLMGTAYLAFYGELQQQTDDSLDMQFRIYRAGSPTLVFYIKDVGMIQPNTAGPIVDLKKMVDQNQVVE